MNINKAIQLEIFSCEDIKCRPSWITVEGEFNKFQAILEKLSSQNVELSLVKVRKLNGDEWFCIYYNSYFCYCRCSYNDDSQDYSDINKIQVDFGYEKNHQIVFDSNYNIMDILMPLNANT